MIMDRKALVVRIIVPTIFKHSPIEAGHDVEELERKPQLLCPTGFVFMMAST